MSREILILGLLVGAWAGCGDDEQNPADSRGPVAFADAHLEASVRETLGKPTDELSQGMLLSLTRLDASGREIVDLAGIEQLKNLEVLRLADNQIRDIAALSTMAQLCTLDLAHNQVERLEPLVELSRLRYLRLNDNAVRDITPLFRLKRLTHVELSGNPLDENSSNVLVKALREMEIEVVINYLQPAQEEDGTEEENGTDRTGIVLDFHLVFSSGMLKSDLWLVPADSTRRILLSEEPEGYGLYDLFWSPDRKKIGFVRGKTSIFTIETDGTHKTKLAGSSLWEDQFIDAPSWSPDGQRILFAALKGKNFDVCTMNTDGTDVRNLTDDPADDRVPRWSPDGQRVLFTRSADASSGSGDHEIFVADADGSNPVDLTNDPANDFGGAWSPDGTRVAFASNRAGSWDIWVMDADGRRVLRLTDDLGTEYFPAWSPDGTRIAFLQYWDPSSSDSDVLVMEANGGAQRNLTDYPSGHANLQWSPDNSKVLFLSNRDGSRDIYMVDADGGDLVNVTQDTVGVVSFAVAPK